MSAFFVEAFFFFFVFTVGWVIVCYVGSYLLPLTGLVDLDSLVVVTAATSVLSNSAWIVIRGFLISVEGSDSLCKSSFYLSFSSSLDELASDYSSIWGSVYYVANVLLPFLRLRLRLVWPLVPFSFTLVVNCAAAVCFSFSCCLYSVWTTSSIAFSFAEYKFPNSAKICLNASLSGFLSCNS